MGDQESGRSATSFASLPQIGATGGLTWRQSLARAAGQYNQFGQAGPPGGTGGYPFDAETAQDDVASVSSAASARTNSTFNSFRPLPRGRPAAAPSSTHSRRAHPGVRFLPLIIDEEHAERALPLLVEELLRLDRLSEEHYEAPVDRYQPPVAERGQLVLKKHLSKMKLRDQSVAFKCVCPRASPLQPRNSTLTASPPPPPPPPLPPTACRLLTTTAACASSPRS